MTNMIHHQEMVRYCRLIKDDENWMTCIHILLQILVFPPVTGSETWSLIWQWNVYCVFQFCFSKNNTHDKHCVDWLSSNVKQRLLQLRLFAATTLTYLNYPNPYVTYWSHNAGKTRKISGCLHSCVSWLCSCNQLLCYCHSSLSCFCFLPCHLQEPPITAFKSRQHTEGFKPWEKLPIVVNMDTTCSSLQACMQKCVLIRWIPIVEHTGHAAQQSLCAS
jgi:hypothetical protein